MSVELYSQRKLETGTPAEISEEERQKIIDDIIAAHSKLAAIRDDLSPFPSTFEFGDNVEAVVEPHHTVMKNPEEINTEKLIPPAKAAQMFKSYTCDLENVDFSGRVGFVPEPTPFPTLEEQYKTPYEIASVPPERLETMAQRYDRLLLEVDKLITGLQKEVRMREEEDEEPEYGSVRPDKLLETAIGLKVQLEDLLEKDDTSRVVCDATRMKQLAAQQAELTEKLRLRLQEQKTVGKKSSAVPTSSAGAEAGIAGTGESSYELLFSPDDAKAKEAVLLGDLERRLAALEKLLGPATPELPKSDMQTAILTLDKKLTSLDDTKLENAEILMEAISNSLEELARRRAKAPVSEGTIKKVDQIFEKLDRWDSLGLQLPVVVKRLKALKMLHQEVQTYPHAVESLKETQTSLASSIAEHEQNTDAVQKRFSEGVDTIQRMMVAMEAKMAEVERTEPVVYRPES